MTKDDVVHIESNVRSIQVQIDQLQATESEMARDVDKQQSDLLQLEKERERVTNENDTLKAHAEKFA